MWIPFGVFFTIWGGGIRIARLPADMKLFRTIANFITIAFLWRLQLSTVNPIRHVTIGTMSESFCANNCVG